MSALPPAQPSYVFRGHVAQIHSVQIVRQNTRLVTGDADGWVVFWSLESKRPAAVWRAHDAAILGTGEWSSDNIITHGRDNALRIWQLRPTDEVHLSSELPADGSTMHRPKPWLLHTLPVNTLNFCAFSMSPEPPAFRGGLVEERASPDRLSDSILVAVPARDDKKVEVYRFPDEKLVCSVPRVQPVETGMVMALKLAYHRPSNNTILIAGYEGGYTAVHLLGHTRHGSQATSQPWLQLAETIYISQPHSQPVLSLDVAPDAKTYFTSSADAVIAAHRIPDLPLNIDDGDPPQLPEDGVLSMELPIADTATPVPSASSLPSTTTQSLSLIPGTMNADAAISTTQHLLPSNVNLSESKAELRTADKTQTTVEPIPGGEGGREESINPAERLPAAELASADVLFSKKQVSAPSVPSSATATPATPSGLSSFLSTAPPLPKVRPDAPSAAATSVLPPYKSVQTKHAGQQSLCVRSDGRLLVTGGWDSRVRIYSTKTLKEMAVLKWHQQGVYAAGFGEILDGPSMRPSPQGNEDGGSTSGAVTTLTKAVSSPYVHDGLTGLSKLQKQREIQMQMKHWVVAGSKDGKVSLWEVF